MIHFAHIGHRFLRLSGRQKYLSSIILLPLALMLAACSSSAAQEENTAAVARPVDVPTSRSFSMGFTPFHYSWIEEKLPETYALIQGHSDMILHHFDEGVPWPEAYSNVSFHEEVEKELQYRKSQLREGQKVFVATTPIDFAREKMAGYWAEKEGMDLPRDWERQQLDSPEVIQAYINYCRRLIEEFNPDYFAYGIEVNLLARNSPEEYARFVNLASQVYPALKSEYPDLPIMVSFYVLPPDHIEEAKSHVGPLLPYTDYYAISTYPYMGVTGDSYPVAEIPERWFSQATEIAPGKPFAIAETGYIAEDFSAYFNRISSNESEQRAYVERMLIEAYNLDAEFVIWFVVADYDDLWTIFRYVVMFNPLVRAWKDTGLFDGDLNPRPALNVWDFWLSTPRRVER